MTDFGSFGLDTDEVTTRSVETDFARRFGQYFARRIVSRFIHDMQTVVSALRRREKQRHFVADLMRERCWA